NWSAPGQEVQVRQAGQAGVATPPQGRYIPRMTSPLRIKICGVTSESDARQAAMLGADAIGLNFYAQSPRCVDPAVVPQILRVLPPFVEAVGVFAGLTLVEISAQCQGFELLRTVQRHNVEHEIGDFSLYPFRLIDAFQVPGRHT